VPVSPAHREAPQLVQLPFLRRSFGLAYRVRADRSLDTLAGLRRTLGRLGEPHAVDPSSVGVDGLSASRLGSFGPVIRRSASATGRAAMRAECDNVLQWQVTLPHHRGDRDETPFATASEKARCFLRPSFSAPTGAPSGAKPCIQQRRWRFDRFLASRSRFPDRLLIAFSGLPHRLTSFGIHSH
jgi:hypothetical protein